MKRNLYACAALAALLGAPLAKAADHLDGPKASADPTADITDLFAWMSPAAKTLYLIMNVFPQATAASKFSNAVQYVFHDTSRNNFGDAASSCAPGKCSSAPRESAAGRVTNMSTGTLPTRGESRARVES